MNKKIKRLAEKRLYFLFIFVAALILVVTIAIIILMAYIFNKTEV